MSWLSQLGEWLFGAPRAQLVCQGKAGRRRRLSLAPGTGLTELTPTGTKSCCPQYPVTTAGRVASQGGIEKKKKGEGTTKIEVMLFHWSLTTGRWIWRVIHFTTEGMKLRKVV